MRAILCERYGSPDVLELREIDKPAVGDDDVLVQVHASSVNPLDWHVVTGTPFIARLTDGLRKPKNSALGVDLAGRVEAVGRNVRRFQPGDEVFGAKRGAFAEYVLAPENLLVQKPANLGFDQAAAAPVAAVTALQAVRDKGRVQPGQKVLINGAGGGVGTFAVQIAKSFGAEVTGVCSTTKVDLVRSIGADHVVDYTREDFTRSGERHDVMLDIAGSRSFSEFRRVLEPTATVVVIGGPRKNRLLGPLSHAIKVRLASLGRSQTAGFYLSTMENDELVALRELFDAGNVTPVIGRRYGLSEVPDALRYLGEGHARGKVIITV
jgi:NADPH:quinone reductase-like Zn-dependent oxidoreductase